MSRCCNLDFFAVNYQYCVCTGLFLLKVYLYHLFLMEAHPVLILSIAVSIVIRVSYENKYNYESYKNETKKIHISAAGSGGILYLLSK